MLRGSESVHQRIETPERSQPKPEWDSEEAELDQRVDRWRHVAALRKDHVPGHASVIIKPELGALAQESKADPIEIAQPAGPHSLVGHEVPPHRVVHIRLHEDLDNRVEVLWMLARRVQSRRDGVALDEGCSSRPRTRRLHRSSRRRSAAIARAPFDEHFSKKSAIANFANLDGQSVIHQLFHGPAPRSPLCRLFVRLRRSRSNTCTK